MSYEKTHQNFSYEKTHQYFKLKALETIAKGQDFHAVYKSAFYETTLKRKRLVDPPAPPGTHWTYEPGLPEQIEETYTYTAKENYLDNPNDTNDFFNTALISNNKNLLHHFLEIKWAKTDAFGQRWSCINNPLVIKPDCFKIYAIKNQCSQSGINDLEKVVNQLLILEKKIKYLNAMSYTHEARIAYELLKNLQIEIIDYVASEELNANAKFKQNCLRHIQSKETKCLFEPGWKDFLANLTLAVIGVGVLYLAAAAINYHCTKGKHFFFHFESDTEKVVNEASSLISSCVNIK